MPSTSLMAKRTALDVLDSLRRGKKPNIKRIAMSHGYAETSAHTSVPQNTKTYQDIINPVLAKWESERLRITKALQAKDLEKEKYSTLVDALEKLNKSILLLGGRSTENVSLHITISEAIAKKNTEQK